MPDRKIADDGLFRIVHDLLQNRAVLGVVYLILGLADQDAAHGLQYARVFEVQERRTVLLGPGPLLAGFQEQNAALPVLRRGKEPVLRADRRRVGIAPAVKEIEQRADAAAQNFPAKDRAALQKLEAAVFVGDGADTELLGAEARMLLIPEGAGADLGDAPGLDELLKILPGIGQHLGAELADLRQERLAVEARQAQLVEHQVVHRRVGKAKEGLLRHGVF